MKVWELIKVQEPAFWALFVLLAVESGFALNFHILMCNLPLADTLLLFVSLFHHGNTRKEASAPLFQRICGCVSFCAILFVNASHALEMMTEPLTASSNSTDVEDHDDHEDSAHADFGIFTSCLVPAIFIPVILSDLLLKWILLCAGRLQDFSLSKPLQVILHLLAPIAVISLYAIGWQREKEDFFLLPYLDPLVTILLCVIYAVMIAPAFRDMKPYVFADTPLFFDNDKFTAELSANFDGVQCTHIHVYRIWPNESFEALIHINIEVANSDDDWNLAATRYSEISAFIQNTMKSEGAEKVVIEPRFIDHSVDNPEWQGCVDGAKCFVEDRGCCSVMNEKLSVEH